MTRKSDGPWPGPTCSARPSASTWWSSYRSGSPVTCRGRTRPVSKQLWTQAEQYLQHLAMDIAGAEALTGAAPERLADYFQSRPTSVYGGTAQIQRNLLAQRVLGLPRS